MLEHPLLPAGSAPVYDFKLLATVLMMITNNSYTRIIFKPEHPTGQLAFLVEQQSHKQHCQKLALGQNFLVE